jgi:hypothetical protein
MFLRRRPRRALELTIPQSLLIRADQVIDEPPHACRASERRPGVRLNNLVGLEGAMSAFSASRQESSSLWGASRCGVASHIRFAYSHGLMHFIVPCPREKRDRVTNEP